MQGIIVKNISNDYEVDSANRIYNCKASGKFRSNKIIPLVGDIVEFDEKNNYITNILPRKNELIRPSIANIDIAVIVVIQVEVVVVSLHDRIADTGIRPIDIADNIGILCAKLGKVNADLLRLRLSVICRITGIVIILGFFTAIMNRRDEFIGNGILLLFAQSLLIQIADDLNCRKYQHCQQNDQQDIV